MQAHSASRGRGILRAKRAGGGVPAGKPDGAEYSEGHKALPSGGVIPAPPPPDPDLRSGGLLPGAAKAVQTSRGGDRLARPRDALQQRSRQGA